MTFVSSIKSGFKNFANYSGRASRSDYWYFYLFTLLINLPFKLLEHIDHELILILSVVTLIILIVPFISLQVRRYHDVGLSGKWFLLLLVIGLGVWIAWFWIAEIQYDFYPIFGVISISCFLANFVISCKMSNFGDNSYGPNPLLVETETQIDGQPGQPIELSSNENPVKPTKNEISKTAPISNTETRISEIEDMFERSVINKRERDKLRKKALGLE